MVLLEELVDFTEMAFLYQTASDTLKVLATDH